VHPHIAALMRATLANPKGEFVLADYVKESGKSYEKIVSYVRHSSFLCAKYL
jgi:hypothetical protein